MSRLWRAVVSVSTALALTAAPAAWALGPLEKNQPAVQRGLDAYAAGKYEDALAAFEEAGRELPRSAAVEFNRGNALYRLGRVDEAKKAWERVLSLDPGELQSKDLYNLGTALAKAGDEKEAISALRRALRADPGNADARHNLEVLLRKKQQPPSPDGGMPDGGKDGGEPPDAGMPDGGRPDAGADAGQPDGGADGGSDGGRGPDDGGSNDAGTDGGTDGGSGGDGGTDGGADGGRGQQGDAGQPDAGHQDGGQPSDRPEPADAGQDGGAQAQAGEGTDGGSDEPDGGVAAGVLDREQAEKLLDSMKQNEKNLQLWRFQQKRPRRSNEKDW